MERFKRLFSSKRQPEKISKSIRCTKAMWTAIEKLAKDQGESPNAYIILALDQHLQVELERGNIPAPTFDEENAAS